MSTEPHSQPAVPPPDPTAQQPDFDPYTEYLNLPPGPRPPHLYSLLGLELFCPHPEQIAHAVRKQFRVVKPFEEHPQRHVRERVQDVMSHIATARVVLSDPGQKEEYDELLARHLGIDRGAVLQQRTAVRPPEFELVVVTGPLLVGTRLELLPDRVITLGQDSSCGLPLTGSRLADVHARLEYTDEGWLLRSARPEHVTLVNEQRCSEFLLSAGDVLTLGGYQLACRALDQPAPDPHTLPPPLSLVVRQGTSIPEPVLNALPPASIIIGHCETAVWQLADPLVSRHHARIRTDQALWQIEDLHSTNGTLLNGEAVTIAVLRHRDLLTIGRFEIQVSLRR